MSLETMDIDLYIDESACILPGETYEDEQLDSVSGYLDPMDLEMPPDQEFYTEEHIQNPSGIPNPLSDSDAEAFWSEHDGVFKEHFSDYVMSLTFTEMGSASSISLLTSQEPHGFPESASQTSPQNLIPFLSRQSNIVPPNARNQVLRDASQHFLQTMSQSALDLPCGTPFQLGFNSQDERATETQYLSHARHTSDRGNADQLEPCILGHGNLFESHQHVVNSAFVPQDIIRSTADVEVYTSEQAGIINTHSEISDQFASQKLVTGITDNGAEQDLSDIQVLETYQHEGFSYSKVRIHSPATCPDCEKTYANESYLREHIKRSHGNESQPGLQCPHCNLKVANEINLLRHIQSSHRHGMIVEVCEICNASFSSSFSATVHKRAVHGIQASNSRQRSAQNKNIFFRCNACGSYMKEKGNMNRHMDIVHLQRRDFHCECGLTFKTKHNLHCHIISKNCHKMKV